jgi:uncharacterized protein YjiS (DUF1127 family)
MADRNVDCITLYKRKLNMITSELRLSTGFLGEPPRSGSRPLGVHTWLGWVAHRLAAVRRIQQRRQAIGQLIRMSDSRLQDLGIPRDRIAEVVDGLIAQEGPSVARRAD